MTFSDPVEAETRVVEMVVWIDHARVSTNARGLDGEFRADKVHRNGDGHDYFAVSCRLDGVKYGYEPDEVDPAVSLIGKVATIKQGKALADLERCWELQQANRCSTTMSVERNPTNDPDRSRPGA